MSQSDSELARVETLADSFLQHYRRGEQPHVSEYTDRHPELATLIRDLFPAVMLMEEAGPPSPCCASPGLFTPSSSLPKMLGEYRLLREIGRGGMGIVYEAVQERLERHVALKVLPSFNALAATSRERFQQEAKVAAQLQHPNIVPVFDVGAHEGIHFYVMQFIRGRPLDRMLAELRRRRLRASNSLIADPSDKVSLTPWIRRASDSRLSSGPSNSSSGSPPGGLTYSGGYEDPQYFRSVAQIGVQAADALRHAHQHGVLHRDVKPSNLLLDEDARLWVTDFGLAKLRESTDLTQSGEIVGTLRYMAPERFQGRSDPRSDIYSLGATLYELLTLRPMYPDQDRMQLVHTIAHTDPPRPRTLVGRLPAELEAIVLKAIARNPDDRFATAEELRNALQRYLGQQSANYIDEAPEGPVAVRSPNLRRSAIAAFLLATLIGVLMFLSGPSLRLLTVIPRITHAARTAPARVPLPQDTSPLAMARRLLQRGLQLCEQDRINHGLLMMARSLPYAVEAGDADLERTIRRNLESWYPLQHLGAIVGDRKPLTMLAVSPGGDQVLIVNGNTARLWNIISGEALAKPIQRSATIRFVLFSPDGRYLLIGCNAGLSQLYDAASCDPIGEPLENQGWVVAASFSSDGRYLLLGDSQHRAQVWNVQTGQTSGPPIVHTQPLQFVALRSDQILLTGDRSSIRISDAVTGQILGRIEPSYTMTAVAVSADGAQVLTGGAGGEAQCWDVATLQPGPTVHHSSTITAVAFSPDGTKILTGSADGHMRLWSSRTAEPAGPAWQQDGALLKLAFSPDGRTVAVLSERDIIRIWDPVTGYQVGAPVRYQTPITAFALAVRGNRLVVGSRGGLQVYIVPGGTTEDPEVAQVLIERLTATELDEHGKARPLSVEGWLARHQRALEWEAAKSEELWEEIKQIDEQLRAKPEDARLWEQRGWKNVLSQRWQDAIGDFTRAEQLDPAGCNFSGGRAYCYAMLGNWSAAADDYAELVKIQPNTPEFTFIFAAMLHLAGRSDEFVSVCQDALERFGDIDDPRAKYIVARMCVLASDPRLDSTEPLRLASEANEMPPVCPAYLHTHGLALIRAGRYDEAIVRLRESTQSGWYGSVLNHLAIAIAHQQAGRPDHAQRSLAEAERMLDVASQYLPAGVQGGYPPHPHDWPACAILHREAQALIRGR